MQKESQEKWAANIAFVGDKETVKELLKMFSKLEEEGRIKDFNKIDGPYDSLQTMLKRRKENLALHMTETILSSGPKLIDGNDKSNEPKEE
jgi:hypothetical protein